MKKLYQTLFAKTALLAVLISGTGYAQEVYTVESIPHHVFAADLPVQYTLDDVHSQILDIPFDFKFFGNDYSHCVISTNGYISFNIENAEQPSYWSITESVPSTAFNENIWNSIMGCYHDMDASNDSDGEATITWSVTGDAPFRQFVVMFDNQSQFSCGNEAESSFQMVLYETFNYIDSQIIQRQVCEWNNGYAIIGIMNSTAEIGFTPPGRNTGAWEVVTPEGWRFRPESDPMYRYIMCDAGLDGLETFDLTIVQGDLDPSAIFYETMEDAALAQTRSL